MQQNTTLQVQELAKRGVSRLIENKEKNLILQIVDIDRPQFVQNDPKNVTRCWYI
jgi:hypothetical protein